MAKRRTRKKHKAVWPTAIVFIGVVIALGAAYLWLDQPDYEPTEQNIIKVKLYYYNQLADKEQTFKPEFVLPVVREIAKTKTPIKDTINLLLQGRLTWQERADGFTTEFPNARFQLLGATLRGTILTLEFTDVPGFTTGGAARVSLLAAQIEMTAKQFPQVRMVRFKPDYLLQP